MTEKRCGTCLAYGMNLYKGPMKDRTCSAGVLGDVPASWSINTMMDENDGAECPFWNEYEEPLS